MAETTSQTISSVTVAIASAVTTSSMFTTTPESHLYGGSSVPLGYQSLSGTHSGVSSSPCSSPMLSTGILPGSSLTDTEQFDPSSQYQDGPSGYHPVYPLNTGLPPYGEKYTQSAYSSYSRGPPYGDIPSSLGPTYYGMIVYQWQPTMLVQPRLVYPSQPIQPISSILLRLSLRLYHSHKLN